MGWLITRLIRCKYQCLPNDRLLGGFSLVVLVYGLTTNVFEAQVLALTLGVIARCAFDDKFIGLVDPEKDEPNNATDSKVHQ